MVSEHVPPFNTPMASTPLSSVVPISHNSPRGQRSVFLSIKYIQQWRINNSLGDRISNIHSRLNPFISVLTDLTHTRSSHQLKQNPHRSSATAIPIGYLPRTLWKQECLGVVWRLCLNMWNLAEQIEKKATSI